MKYIPKPSGKKKHKGDGLRGRYVNPDKWITGPDINVRMKYYAFLKHRTQALWRGEEYELTWEDWQILWPDHKFEQRGRKITDLCLARKDYNGVWSLDNCETCTRRQHFKRRSEFERANKSNV